MAVSVKILDSDMSKLLTDFRKYSTKKQKEVMAEMGSTARRIDKRQKEKLRFHSATSRRNYSAMMAANIIKVLGNYASVANNHKAGEFFEFGTRPHKIKIKNKKVLATLGEYTSSNAGKMSTDKKGNNWRVFGKEVNHPGTKPKPFFYHPVLIEHKPYIMRLKKILENAK